VDAWGGTGLCRLVSAAAPIGNTSVLQPRTPAQLRGRTREAAPRRRLRAAARAQHNARESS